MKQFDYLNSKVWLLVRAVTGGAIPKAFGIMAKNNKTFQRAFSPNN